MATFCNNSIRSLVVSTFILSSFTLRKGIRVEHVQAYRKEDEFNKGHRLAKIKFTELDMCKGDVHHIIIAIKGRQMQRQK